MARKNCETVSIPKYGIISSELKLQRFYYHALRCMELVYRQNYDYQAYLSKKAFRLTLWVFKRDICTSYLELIS